MFLTIANSLLGVLLVQGKFRQQPETCLYPDTRYRNFGKWHTERGLTFSTVELSGHMIPQYAPTAAYRLLEFLLGRIDDLGEISDFTTQTGDFGNNGTITMF